MTPSPESWRRSAEIIRSWTGWTPPLTAAIADVAPVTDPAGRHLPHLFDVRAGTTRRRALVLGRRVLSASDPDALAGWVREHAETLRDDPGPWLLHELLGHLGHLPAPWWRGPTWDLNRLTAAWPPAHDTSFATELTPHAIRLTLPTLRHDNGNLLGHRAGVAGPGGAATAWRLVVELGFDGHIHHSEELAVWTDEGWAWQPLHDGLHDGLHATPMPRPDDTPHDELPPTPYSSAAEHFDDLAHRVQLLLLRHLRRFWFRATDGSGHLNDTFVAADEVAAVFSGEEDTTSPLGELPAIATLDAQLAAHRLHVEARTAATIEHGVHLPVEELRTILSLEDSELDVLLAVAASQVRLDLHRLMRRAQADFTSVQPTLAFLAELVATDRDSERALLRLAHFDHPARRLGVLRFGEEPEWRESSPVGRLRVALADRVVAFLLGQHGASLRAFDDTPGGLTFTAELLQRSPEDARERLPIDLPRSLTLALRGAHRLTREAGDDPRVAATTPTVLLHGPDPSVMRDLVAAAIDEIGPSLVVDWSHLNLAAPHVRVDLALTAVAREACLCQAGLTLLLGEQGEPDEAALRLLAAIQRILPFVPGGLLIGVARPWGGLRRVIGPCPELHVPLPDPAQRLRLWRRALAEPLRQNPALETSVRDLATRYALPASAIQDAVRCASVARGQNTTDLAWTLLTAVREQITHKLGVLAERFSTPLTWDDLVLPPRLKDRLREMLDYARNERRVYDTWGFGRLHAYGRGLTALFAGPPGTGKTLAAAIMARELGAELYRVDLSRVVDKYIGETEKNLARIFDEAERGRAILLFDEADSLFAKRTAVKSSNDRYANQEVNFLLQRMEHFDGTSILTTNARDALDDAFQRRIKFRLEFELPDATERLRIWRSMVPPTAPVTDDIDWNALARDFEMAPAHIKNAALRAAFRAAQDGTSIHHRLLYESAQVEYRELGNLVRSQS